MDERPRKIILYDGVCALCNWFVETILPLDKHEQFYFVSQQSELAGTLMAKHQITLPPLESIVFLDEESRKVFTKSQALFQIGKHLGGIWKILSTGFSFLFPRAIADYLYDIVARNRYKTFGKYDTCPLPDPKYRKRFL